MHAIVHAPGDTAACFATLHELAARGKSVFVGVASRSDEPEWARKCLRKFVVAPGISMMDVITEPRCEIYAGNKQTHFAALHQKTGVPFHNMCFFDDQQGNIRDVASLGVHCLYTPSGMTKATFDRGLQAATQSGRGGWTAFDATSPLRPEP